MEVFCQNLRGTHTNTARKVTIGELRRSVSRIAPVGLSHKNGKAATVPNAPVRAVASPMIKRIVSCVARKQDKQKIL